MNRRELIGLLGGAASSVAWPLAARAQPAMPVIGFMNSGSEPAFRAYVEGFMAGLQDTGHREGRNVAIEYRWANGDVNRLPELARDLLARKIDLLVAAGGEPAALAARAATATVPTLFNIAGDPVKLGLVMSFNRPDGNLTGMTGLAAELDAKRLELLVDFIPNAATVAVLVNPRNPNVDSQLDEFRGASRRLGRELVILTAHTPAEIDTAILALGERRVGGLVVGSDPLFNNRRTQIVEMVNRQATPAIFQWREFATAGGLASYGSNLVDQYRELGRYAGRLLNGEKPSELPVLQPTRFELVINLKTAKALGLDVAPTLLARADEVIE